MSRRLALLLALVALAQPARADEARDLLAGLVPWFTERRTCPDAVAAREILREQGV